MRMRAEKKILRADALMLLAAVVWGFAFVAQRAGMEHLGPFYFTAIRFAVGGLLLVPLLLLRRDCPIYEQIRSAPSKQLVWVGIALFGGVSFQQVGLVYTSAGNAGFITGLYVILVPFLTFLLGRSLGWADWCSAALAVVGLYLLCDGTPFASIEGDVLVLFGAIVWAGHFLLVDKATETIDPILIAVVQFIICAVLSFLIAFLVEEISWNAIEAAAIPLAYGSVMSVGLAYTIQVVAQKEAEPTHAAVILSMESVFAVLGGYLILGESISAKGQFGCLLMLAAMLVSQLLANNVKK